MTLAPAGLSHSLPNIWYNSLPPNISTLLSKVKKYCHIFNGEITKSLTCPNHLCWSVVFANMNVYKPQCYSLWFFQEDWSCSWVHEYLPLQTQNNFTKFCQMFLLYVHNTSHGPATISCLTFAVLCSCMMFACRAWEIAYWITPSPTMHNFQYWKGWIIYLYYVGFVIFSQSYWGNVHYCQTSMVK